MTTRYRRTLWIFMLMVSGMVFISLWQLSRRSEQRIQGRVTDGDAPVANAVVRVQGAAAYVLSDAWGDFVLPFVDTDEVIHVTASAPGYYIAVATSDGLAELHLRLKPHPTLDNPAYAFISPVLDPDNPTACGRCHSSHVQTANSTLPVDEWLKDAHASAATNPRFLSVYNGTTLDGTPGAPTTYHYDAAVGVDIPAAPSQGQQDAGAGFRLDFPNETG
ncbi:MAG: carboxypeptidase-like regulatory domain-containing protein, partial [Anaerolineae bacterium]|nr:carboxypeptidase-like regulatory domain-containing protein [Anaerolineae bacterium]